MVTDIVLLNKANAARQTLKPKKTIQVHSDAIYTDILNAYREDETLESYRVVIHVNNVGSADDNCTGAVLTRFWDEALNKHFTGTNHMVPALDSNTGEDLFQTLGRILVHGFVQENFVPLRISPACLAFILANTCSDQLILSSFFQVMSKTEREVVFAALAEAKLGVEKFSPRVYRSLKIILGSYGCSQIPAMHELEASVRNIARGFLLHRPYWPLCQIQEVFCQSELDMSAIDENDVIRLYNVLSSDVPNLLQRVKYTFSESSDARECEKNAQTVFEEYLHKISRHEIQKLLQNWCGFDCLCVKHLLVKFQSDDSPRKPFEQSLNTLWLPSSLTSVVELRHFLDDKMSSANLSDTSNGWEYTL